MEGYEARMMGLIGLMSDEQVEILLQIIENFVSQTPAQFVEVPPSES